MLCCEQGADQIAVYPQRPQILVDYSKELGKTTARTLSFALRSVNERMPTVGPRCSDRPAVRATACAVQFSRCSQLLTGVTKTGGRPAAIGTYQSIMLVVCPMRKNITQEMAEAIFG